MSFDGVIWVSKFEFASGAANGAACPFFQNFLGMAIVTSVLVYLSYQGGIAGGVGGA